MEDQVKQEREKQLENLVNVGENCDPYRTLKKVTTNRKIFQETTIKQGRIL